MADVLFSALRAGASGFLPKDVRQAELIEAVSGRGAWVQAVVLAYDLRVVRPRSL
jgi:DNA-binding NarL/FixJ family response regulator